jgi:hypothetical protein
MYATPTSFEGSGNVLGTGEKVGKGASILSNPTVAKSELRSFLSSQNALVWVALAFLVMYWWKAQKNRDAIKTDYEF